MDLSELKQLQEIEPPERRLAALIRLGHPMVEENKHWFLMHVGERELRRCGCAIGAALAAKGHMSQLDFEEEARKSGIGFFGILARELDIPTELARVVSRAHQHGVPRLEIARQLEEGTFQWR